MTQRALSFRLSPSGLKRPGETKAGAIDTPRRKVSVAIGRAEYRRIEEPGAAAQHATRKNSSRNPWLFKFWRIALVVFMPWIETPFENIAVHVPKAPRIGVVGADIARRIRL